MSLTSRLKKALGNTIGFATTRNCTIGTAVATVATLAAPGIAQMMGGDLGVTSDQVAMTATAVGYGGAAFTLGIAKKMKNDIARIKDLGNNRPEAVLSKAGSKADPQGYLAKKLADMTPNEQGIMEQYMQGVKTLDAVTGSQRGYTDKTVARGMRAYNDLSNNPNLGRNNGNLSLA